jgi:hypothetical protein
LSIAGSAVEYAIAIRSKCILLIFISTNADASHSISSLNFYRINKYGVPQLIPKPGHRREEVEDIISQTITYMNGVRRMQEQSTDDKYKDIMVICKNKDALCSEWALDDGCDDNPNYMKVSCAPACKSCEYIIEQNCGDGQTST